MKKILSMLTVFMVLVNGITLSYAETDNVLPDNLLIDGSFENTELVSSGWKFSDAGIWYGEGTVGTEDGIVKDGNVSVMINDGVAAQKITLEAGKKYELSAAFYPTVINSTANIVIYDGTAVWPGNSVVKSETMNFDWENDWQSISIEFDCENSQEYVIGFYGLKATVYVDEVSMRESDTAEAPDEPSDEPSSAPASETPEQPNETPGVSPDPGMGDNLLRDHSFESGELCSDNSWKFTGGENWYGYGTAGEIGIDNIIAKTGTNSVKISDGMIGQRVVLEAGKRYKLSAQLYSTEFYSSVNMGFYDGETDWPGSNAVKVISNGFDWCDSWGDVSVVFDCEYTKEYVVGFFESGATIYIDDVVLLETDEEETLEYRINGDYNAVSGVYNSDKLLNVSRGGYLINRNQYWMPSLYDKLQEDGINMVRMDWILSDQFYHVVSADEDGSLQFDFTLLDAAILPLLEKGMTPYMCMNAIPSVLGGTGKRGENSSGMSAEQLNGYIESVKAVVQHYKDLGYTGWYWESDNEPEDRHMGNVSHICEKYGLFAKAVKEIDPDAKVGGIGYRNGDVNKDETWKTTFYTYLKNNPEVPLDFLSIHVYNGVTDFTAADSYIEKLEELAPERKGIPVIFSEWNYDWTVGTAGSHKDTNANAAYIAKRLSSAITQDNVDYVFYFTPSDAITPGNRMNGDSGLYTIDGHRKSAANTFRFYSDLESEIITSEADMLLDRSKMTAGFVSKNSDSGRVTLLAFNYSDIENEISVDIKNLPYANSNVKMTVREINTDSGNYYKDYADGYRGYSITPHELPDERVKIIEGMDQYTDTLTMPAYSVVEIILEPTDEPLFEETLAEKPEPVINVAYGGEVTSNSVGKNGVVGYNSTLEDFDFSNVWEQTTEENGDEYLIEEWGTEKLTDGYRLSFDRGDISGTEFGMSNLGYRSEAFETAANNVWVQIELDKTESINTVKLYPVSNRLDNGQGFPVDFEIQVSNDGEIWTTVAEKNDYKSNGPVIGVQEFVFDNVDAKYVRLNATELSQTADGYRLQLAEIELMNDPYAEPDDDPAAETEGIIINADDDGITVSSDIETEAVIVKTAYDENGALRSIEISDTSQISIGENDVSFTTSPALGDKIMIWNNLDEMRPLCCCEIVE